MGWGSGAVDEHIDLRELRRKPQENRARIRFGRRDRGRGGRDDLGMDVQPDDAGAHAYGGKEGQISLLLFRDIG